MIESLVFRLSKRKAWGLLCRPMVAQIGSVCPVAVVFDLEGMGFHVRDELLVAQPCPA